MTVPAALRACGFDHVSEREPDGSWEDCTWCAGLEWYRICFDRTRPSTLREAEALRAASGEPPTGGSNITNFRDGVRARYGRTLPAAIVTFGTLRDKLRVPGTAALVQGSMSAFGPTHRLSVYDRNFDGGHATLVVNVDGVLYWCDPEAPESAAVPVTITWDELERFVKAFPGGQHLVASLSVQEENLVPIVTPLPGYSATIKAGSNVRAEPRIGAQLIRTQSKDSTTPIIGTVKGDVDPKNGSNVWYMWWNEGGGRWEFTAKDNVKDVTSGASTPAYPDVRADLARAQADLTVANQKITALQTLADIGSAAVALIKKAGLTG